jgi:hypothetical protein
VRGNNFFPLWILTLAIEAFSVRLRLELPELNFLLGFRALASANYWAEVGSPELDDPLARLRFLSIF